MTSSNNSGTVAVCTEDVIGRDHSLLLIVGGSNCGDAFDDEVSLGERACLVKAADVDFSSEGNPEGFRAEDLLLNKLND